MDEAQALAAFEHFLVSKEAEFAQALGRVPIAPERLSHGWAFYYQSRDFLETGAFRDQLVGQGPVLVLDDGRVVAGGSLDWPPEVFLKRVW
jgi:hypothetical protein